MLNQHNVSFISVFILLRRWHVIWQVLFQKLRLSSFTTLFSIEHRRLEDVFLGAPSQDRARQTDCLTCAQKTLSCVWCHASDRLCFTANTQMTNFSFQVLVRRRSLFLIFLDLSSLFLLDWLETHLFGRALTRSHKLFFLPWWTILFWDAFLKKRMSPPSWKPEGIAKCRLQICNWVVRN